MIPKPRHLGRPYAEQFCDGAVVSAYRHRPPYPPATFAVLRELLRGRDGPVLDVGCGRGDLTLGLSRIASRVDAVDPSAGMLAEAQRRAGRDHPNVRWIHARAEEAVFDGHYALITAGASLHWMEWDVVLPRLAAALAPGAHLAIVDRRLLHSPWHEALLDLIPLFSTNREYEPYDLVEELAQRGLFRLEGRTEIEMVPFRQSVDDYVEALHSGNGFSRDRMSADAAGRFDAAVRALVREHGVGDPFPSAVGASVEYGRPAKRSVPGPG